MKQPQGWKAVSWTVFRSILSFLELLTCPLGLCSSTSNRPAGVALRSEEEEGSERGRTGTELVKRMELLRSGSPL